MPKIIFRADGSNETGLGHLYRIFALIEMFKDNFECRLITRQNSTVSVIPADYNYTTIPNSIETIQEPEWLAENFKPEYYQIVADGYQFNSSWQKKLKNLNYRLTYIDDLLTEHMYADVVINHSLSVKPSDYETESYVKFGLGTRYAILRPLFLKAAESPRTVTKISTAFVCFGGSDSFDLTLQAAKALLKFKEIKKINVVIGAAYFHNGIHDLKKTDMRISLHQNVSEADLLKIMKESDFGVAPASTILYELCAVKMPVLSGYYVKNQKSIYKGCLDNDIIFAGGDFEKYTIADFESQIAVALAQQNYEKQIESQSKLFDGKIKERFIELFREVNYRKAEDRDMMQVFEWANDPLSRANSYFSEPIALETHKTWFSKKLKDKNSVIYIAEFENKPAGMIRYDIGEENAVVGILIGKSFRGKGLASDFLRDTAKLYFNESQKPILAYIKKENVASVKSFEKADYKKEKEEIIHGCESFIYKLAEK
jgi:UDP-2,4-diacetamido-2,4,6-trideoxy-beta-L-altropyranose hydrolase